MTICASPAAPASGSSARRPAPEKERTLAGDLSLLKRSNNQRRKGPPLVHRASSPIPSTGRGIGTETSSSAHPQGVPPHHNPIRRDHAILLRLRRHCRSQTIDALTGRMHGAYSHRGLERHGMESRSQGYACSQNNAGFCVCRVSSRASRSNRKRFELFYRRMPPFLSSFAQEPDAARFNGVRSAAIACPTDGDRRYLARRTG